MTNIQQLEIDFCPEIWKDVEEYIGYYQVSNLGRIKRLATYHYAGRVGTTKVNTTEKIRQVFVKLGYHRVCLCKDNIRKSVFIHMLVAEAFVGKRQKGIQVNHIDGNKGNNRADNLEWVTQNENMQHAVRLGLVKTRSESVHARKIIAIDKNGNSKTYGSLTDAAIDLKVYVSNIYKCANGKYKTTGGYSFKYH